MRRPIRVLFIHGLESQPNGSKTRMLREQGFEVVAPDMHMGLFRLERENSAVRQLFRLGETRVVLALLAALSGFALRRSSARALLAVSLLTTAWGVARRKALFASALGRSFDVCVAIARDSLEDAKADIVVGSSWGGAVAVQLILERAWQGPTVLLAPAVHKVCTWTRRGDGDELAARLRAISQQVPIIVFHDPSDDTVPFQDSVALAGSSNIDLRPVDAGGHRLLALLERGELAAAIRALAPWAG